MNTELIKSFSSCVACSHVTALGLATLFVCVFCVFHPVFDQYSHTLLDLSNNDSTVRFGRPTADLASLYCDSGAVIRFCTLTFAVAAVSSNVGIRFLSADFSHSVILLPTRSFLNLDIA